MILAFRAGSKLFYVKVDDKTREMSIGSELTDHKLRPIDELATPGDAVGIPIMKKIVKGEPLQYPDEVAAYVKVEMKQQGLQYESMITDEKD